MKDYAKDISKLNRDRNDLKDSQCYSGDTKKSIDLFSHSSHLYLCPNRNEENSDAPLININDIIKLYTWRSRIISDVESELENQFNKLVAKWRKETGGLSTMIHITGNDNYLDIIGMGKPALPFILKDLEREADYWFVALKHIAKPEKDPVPDEHYGDINLMREDWLRWAKENDLL